MHFNRIGQFSVKSGYKLAASIAFDPELGVGGDWNGLWNLKVPPKVKDCLWRICWDVLPHKVNILAKHIVVDIYFILCERPPGNCWHLIFLLCLCEGMLAIDEFVGCSRYGNIYCGYGVP